MSVFEKLCQAARRAEEKGVITPQLAERIYAIRAGSIHYKHLGLELHGLIGQLVPVKGQPSGIEESVRQIEERYRRI